MATSKKQGRIQENMAMGSMRQQSSGLLAYWYWYQIANVR
jgi:hypothetical protein